MTICSSCGGENPPAARFCASCGAALVTAGHEVRKTVTVLFCDVTGSTALGERLDVESLRRVLLRFFESMKAVIEHHGGTVEKFIGDAVMAVFGVPVAHEDDAFRAVRAAAEMREALTDLNDELRASYGATLDIRVGVNTGEVVTGTAERLATGDAINVAARLEQAAQPGEILVGEETARLVRAAIEGEPVGPFLLKGKAEPIPAIRLLSVDPARLARQLDAPMVGRLQELRHLRDVFGAAVAEGACKTCTLVGAAGVGKSRLIAAFLDSVDATVVRGRCPPYGDGISYWPVVEVVKQLPNPSSVGLDATAAGAIDGLVEADAVPATTDEIAWGFRKLIEAVAAQRPLVCVFDDLQWGEDTFLELVEQFGYLSRGAPILLLGMARPELLDRRPGWPAQLPLEPLSREDSDQLVEQRLGGHGIDPQQRDRICAAADGNPLFLEEMVAMLLETRDGDLDVPPTIRALLAARLDQLEPPERAVLECGSVEGEIFHRGTVQALGPAEQQLTSTLTALVRKNLIRPDKPQIDGEEAFRFRHLLIRDAAYDALPKARRAEMHEQFGVWLDDRARTLVELDELVGYHYERAYLYRSELGPRTESDVALARRAGARLLTGGRAALVRKDVPAAIALLTRGANLLPQGDPDRIKGLVDLTEATHWGGGSALPTIEQAISEARATGNERLEAWGRLFRLYDGGYEATVQARIREAEEAAAVFGRERDDAGLAHAWLRIAGDQLDLGHVLEAEAALERSTDYDLRTTDRRRESLLLSCSMWVKVLGPAPVENGIAFGEALLAERGEARCLVALPPLVRLYAMAGRGDRARSVMARGIALAEDVGLAWALSALLSAHGELELGAGHFEAAEREFRLAVEQWERRAPELAPYLAEALMGLGREHEAEVAVARAASDADLTDIEAQVRWRAVKARLLARRGEFDNAEGFAREALARADETEWVPVLAYARVALGEVLAAGGRREEAVAAAREALELHERKGNVVGATEARALLGRLEQPPATTPR